MIELKNLEKTYRTSKGSVTAIKDINITINDGEIFGIIGLSGAGKSTLRRRDIRHHRTFGSRQKHTRPLYKLP